MKKCPFCAEEIQNQALVCKHCGRDVTGPRPLTKKEKGNQAMVGCLIVILLVFGFWVYTLFNSSQPPPTASGPTDSQAAIICQNFVKARLKSPKTADFPFMDRKVVKTGENSFSVASYVDSQNSFGATIRTSFICDLTFKGGEWSDVKNWTLDKLQTSP